MAIEPIPAFPALSDRADGSYNSKAFAWASHMADRFVGQANQLAANLNSIAAGGAYAIPYLHTTDANIGSTAGGRLSFSPNSGGQGDATTIRVDVKDQAGNSVAALLDSMTAGATSTIKGQIRVFKMSDPSQFIIFNVTGYTSNASYRAFSVAAAGYSSVSPFAVGDALLLHFQRTGDKGDTGPATTILTMAVRDQRPSGEFPQNLIDNSWVTRHFNTTAWNDIAGASLSGNTLTLPAGSFMIDASLPVLGGGSHRSRLYNVTAGYVETFGTQARSYYGEVTTTSEIRTVVTLLSPHQFRVEHYLATGSARGGATLANGDPEIYSMMRIAKIK